MNPSELLALQSHVLDASVAIDDLLGAVLSKMINYRALTASVNEHLMSTVAALKHDLAQLMEDTSVLIAFMDSSLDFAFARYDLLREIVLDLAHSFVSIFLIARTAFCFCGATPLLSPRRLKHSSRN